MKLKFTKIGVEITVDNYADQHALLRCIEKAADFKVFVELPVDDAQLVTTKPTKFEALKNDVVPKGGVIQQIEKAMVKFSPNEYDLLTSVAIAKILKSSGMCYQRGFEPLTFEGFEIIVNEYSSWPEDRFEFVPHDKGVQVPHSFTNFKPVGEAQPPTEKKPVDDAQPRDEAAPSQRIEKKPSLRAAYNILIKQLDGLTCEPGMSVKVSAAGLYGYIRKITSQEKSTGTTWLKGFEVVPVSYGNPDYFAIEATRDAQN